MSTRWDKRSKKVKQKVSKYLGRIRHLERLKNTTFDEYFSLDDKISYAKTAHIHEIVKDLVELDLYRHGFTRENGRMMSDGRHSIDPDRLKDMKEVFAMNEGFLAKDTIRAILDYEKIFQKSEKRYAFDFAALFVNAGIDMDKELFIALYKRFFPDESG